MCAPCKIILDSGVAAMAEKTAEMVERGLLTDAQMDQLSLLDELYMAAIPRIVRDKEEAINALLVVANQRLGIVLDFK